MTPEEKFLEAQSLLVKEDLQQSELLFLDLLQEKPDDLRGWDGLGIVYCRRGEFARGIDCFQEALRRWTEKTECSHPPNSPAVLSLHLGLAFRAAGRPIEALEALRRARELAPEDAETVLNLGQLYFELDRPVEAIECFRKLVELQPDNASAWLTLGYILSLRESHSEAIQALRCAVERDASSPDACFFLAEEFRKSERYEESLPFYQRMLQVAGEWPQAVYGLGKSLLALGSLEDGWDAMEFRLACNFGSWERHHLPTWDGDVDDEKTVLAYAEEGIAATLMFASCLPDLVHSVGHCVVECEESLHGLFRRSFPRARIVPLPTEVIGDVSTEGPGPIDEHARRERNPWGIALDRQIALGSLPRYFRRRHEEFPLRKAFLVPDRERVEQWSNRLAEIGGVAKIGVLWQGSWTAETERQTALPLPELRNLMLRHQGDAAWICLQHGSKQKEIDLYRRGVSLQLRLFPEAFRYDLDEMAALLTALDLVVTPPGYVANLAGALGVRTWLLLPSGADWRWNLGSEEIPWYPGMKVYRQQREHSWTEPFASLENDLRQFLATHRPPEEAPLPVLAFPSTGRPMQRGRRAA